MTAILHKSKSTCHTGWQERKLKARLPTLRWAYAAEALLNLNSISVWMNEWFADDEMLMMLLTKMQVMKLRWSGNKKINVWHMYVCVWTAADYINCVKSADAMRLLFAFMFVYVFYLCLHVSVYFLLLCCVHWLDSLIFSLSFIDER